MKKREQTMNWCILVSLFAANLVHAQKGFLNIACGSKSNFTDDRGLVWVPDTNYIQLGQARRVSETVSSEYVYMQNLRKFPKPLNKSCYGIPWSSTHPFLLRLSFYNENWPRLFNYSVETTDMLYESDTLDGSYYESYYEYEHILMTMGTTVYICLNRMSEATDPFISAIQMIEFKHGMYTWAKPTVMLVLIARLDIGGEAPTVRYPNDKFDRIWVSSNATTPPVNLKSTSLEIDANSTTEVPPSAVMQTAQLLDASSPVGFGPFDPTLSNILLLLYFYDVDNTTESITFNVALDGTVIINNLSLLPNHSIVEFPVLGQCKKISCELTLQPKDGTAAVPFNALEVYDFVDSKKATDHSEVQVLKELRSKFELNFTSWVSDPCFVIPWECISCTNMTVSHLYLSGKNLSGRIPQSIATLTGLKYLDFSNNQLEGPLPDLSRLTHLQTINLENNKLNGTLPAWLSTLNNLRELSIGNNNFSGEITPQLAKLGPKFNFSGNHYLISKSKAPKLKGHLISKSKAPKLKGHWTLKAILVATAGAILLIIITGIGFRKYNANRAKGKESSSKVKIPKSSQCISFTTKELISATQDFSHEIGRGGFGPVFHGKFHDGQEIAVKVLSAFSNQGTDEFLNEILLLSGLSHENIVKLLGYCNDSGELMLVYEYMPNGSLKDHLYDDEKCHLELRWKDRLQITLHAALGLHYLHLECKPRIIHRDLKSANILIDRTFNGKLSDLGISRVLENVSHITTTVKGTLGYLDPQYYMTRMLTEKSDIYSFGVVLLEIVCGRQPIDVSLSEDQINIVSWVTSCIDTEDPEHVQLSSIIDSRLKEKFASINSIAMVTGLALKCVRSEAHLRPSIKEVMEILSEALAVEENALSDIGISASSATSALHLSINRSTNSGSCSLSQCPESSSSVKNCVEYGPAFEPV